MMPATEKELNAEISGTKKGIGCKPVHTGLENSREKASDLRNAEISGTEKKNRL